MEDKILGVAVPRATAARPVHLVGIGPSQRLTPLPAAPAVSLGDVRATSLHATSRQETGSGASGLQNPQVSWGRMAPGPFPLQMGRVQ